MMKLMFLAVSLLCAAGSARARSSCFDENFRCDNGDEVSMWDKCSGSQEACDDGSSETPALCSSPNTTLTVGNSLTATVQYEEDHNSVVFLLCDGQTCNGLWLDGPLLNGADGEMQYETDSDCNTEGFECNVGHYFENGTFPTGELVFGLERSDSGLSVWLEGHQDRAAFLPTPAGYSQLRVRPGCWKNNMDVKLGGGPAPIASTTASSDQTKTTAGEPATAAPTQSQSTTTDTPTTPVTSSRTTVTPTSSSPASAPTETTMALTTLSTPSQSTDAPITTSIPSESTDASWPPTPIPECSSSIAYLLLPSKNGCGDYVVCFSGRTQTMPCTPPLLFHYENQNCDWPEKVTCHS